MTYPLTLVVRRGMLAAQCALAVGLLSGGALTAHAAASDPYATSFPATESPISEGGAWLSGKAVGIDWADVRTTPGKVFGTQDGVATGTLAYADSTAILTGTFGSDQEATGTVFNNDTGGDWNAEVELRLRSTMTPHSSTGYEIEFRVRRDGSAYCDLVRWNGPLGNFTPLVHGTGTACAVQTGDVIRATVIGKTITAYKNGTQVMQATDATYTSGNPGVGFFLRNLQQVGNSANYGFSSFTARTLSGGTATATTTPTATPTASPTSTPTPTATPTSGAGVNAYATMQAESFTSKSPRPQTEATTDMGGGLNMGYIRSTDWLSYNTVNFGATPATQFVARVASGAAAGTTGVVEVHLDSPTARTAGSVTVGSTGGMQNWVTMTGNISPTTGTHNVYLVFNSASTGHFANLNWLSFTTSGGAAAPPPPTATATPTATPTPPPAGTGVNAYANIQAEGFTNKSARPQAELTADVGGGLNMGYIRSTDWLSYNTVNFGATPATQFVARVASGAAAGTTGVVEVHLDSASSPAVGSFVIGNTGGLQSWVTRTASISPTTGIHTVYLVFTSASTGHFVNLNWFDFAH